MSTAAVVGSPTLCLGWPLCVHKRRSSLAFCWATAASRLFLDPFISAEGCWPFSLIEYCRPNSSFLCFLYFFWKDSAYFCSDQLILILCLWSYGTAFRTPSYRSSFRQVKYQFFRQFLSFLSISPASSKLALPTAAILLGENFQIFCWD